MLGISASELWSVWNTMALFPVVGVAWYIPMIASALFGTAKSYMAGRKQHSAAQQAHDARYKNNPRWNLRNAVLTQFWNDNNLADRFKDLYPEPGSRPGQLTKTPENVLRMATDAPRLDGTSRGSTLADALMDNAPLLAGLLGGDKSGGEQPFTPEPYDGPMGPSGAPLTGSEEPFTPEPFDGQSAIGEDYNQKKLREAGALPAPIDVGPSSPGGGALGGGQDEEFWRQLFKGQPALLGGLTE